MLKEVCVLNVSLFLTLLAILAIVSVSSQAEPFGDANFREAANYVSVDDALKALPVPVLFPLRQNNGVGIAFSDVVEDHHVNFGTLGEDPRPGLGETSEYMIGKVGVYIIFVESNGELDPNLYDWSETSIGWAKNGIYMALNWWKTQYPFRNPKLDFYVNVETVIGYTKYEPMLHPPEDHMLWVPDVLRRLGCGDGSNHYEIGKSCAHTIRQNWKMDWTFIIFVVNSGVGWPGWGDMRAFAYRNGPYIVLPFGWFYHLMFEGTDELARVVAHEVGHIFGATEEYDGKPERSGYLYELDNDGSGCIMDSPNKWCISRGAMRQVGWVDDNFNGYPDILENKPSIILLNSTSPVTDADEIVIEGVFKLEPYPCKRPRCRSVTINSVIPINATGVLMALEGPFDTAYEPFRLIYRPDVPGYHAISIAIMDAVVGNVESYSRNVLYTYLEVQSIETPLTMKRVDVGSQVPIRFKVVLAHDEEPIQSGRIYVGGFEAMSLGDGWFEVIVSSGSVGRFPYQPTSAEVFLNTDIGSGRLTKIKLGGVEPVEIIYDRVAVSLKAMRDRVDVGTEAPIIIYAWYEYDGQKFVGDVVLSNDKLQGMVGLYTYKAVKIIDRLFNLQIFTTNEVEIIFDRVEIQLTALKERIDVGSVAPIVVKAWYEYDKTPFQGEVYLNEPLKLDKVGSITYYVSWIDDRVYGLKTFKTNDVRVIFDKVVVTLRSDAERVDVGTEAPINIDAKYAFDNTPFVGKLYLSTDKKQDRVGLYNYAVTRIEDELYGLEVFEANEVQIIFDTVIVELESASVRIEAGKRAEIFYKAYYSYDNSRFEGEILLNHDLIFYEVRQVTYTVSRIIDNKYGLKSFKSNLVTVIFDKIKTELEINTIVPFTVKAVFKAYYESDRSPVASGVLAIGSYNLYSERDHPGTYLINYLDVLPATRLVGKFVVKGFDEIKIDRFAVHLGNTVVYLLIVTVVSIFKIHKRTASKVTKIISCPKCGSTDYIGVKVASNLWEYECRLCGGRWQVKN
jgi:hypothetical protein